MAKADLLSVLKTEGSELELQDLLKMYAQQFEVFDTIAGRFMQQME
jgi:hypothetical protein